MTHSGGGVTEAWMLALAACPHHVPPPVADIPDVAALCALRQRDIPADPVEAEAVAMGYAEPRVGTDACRVFADAPEGWVSASPVRDDHIAAP